jgi:hypothetical protein
LLSPHPSPPENIRSLNKSKRENPHKKLLTSLQFCEENIRASDLGACPHVQLLPISGEEFILPKKKHLLGTKKEIVDLLHLMVRQSFPDFLL